MKYDHPGRTAQRQHRGDYIFRGDVVFAVSGALTAARYKMDVLGFVLIGTITGIGGGTIRDLLLGRTVWWTRDTTDLIVCLVASVITFFFISTDIGRRKWMVWSDALGLSVFGVVGCHIALQFGSHPVIAVSMGAVTATGGGVIRDLLANQLPFVLRGQLYARIPDPVRVMSRVDLSPSYGTPVSGLSG